MSEKPAAGRSTPGVSRVLGKKLRGFLDDVSQEAAVVGTTWNQLLQRDGRHQDAEVVDVASSVPPGLSDRLTARCIDCLAVLFPAVLIFWGLYSATAIDLSGVAAAIFHLGVFLLLYSMYEALFVSLRGSTLGKSAMGIRVVVSRTGMRPGLGRALARSLPLALALAPIVGFYMVVGFYSSVLWTEGKKGLHNAIAGTSLVRVRD